MSPMISDEYGRSFKTLRVSLLSKCNMGCLYCTMGEEDVKVHNSSANSLPVKDLLRIIHQLHQQLQLNVVRLTGGEPLLYPHLLEIIKEVKRLGIRDIKLTTNGFLLEKLAVPMKEAGMKSINVSLDAVDEDVFFLMSRRNNVQRIFNGIDAAVEAGMEVKINTVLMKGSNDNQILPLINYAFHKNIPIRFLEVMGMGHLHGQADKYLVSRDEILHTIAAAYDFVPVMRQRSATANYWKTSEGKVFGIIANESTPFCGDCNRLRLDSEGNIYGCLSSNTPIPVVGIDREEDLQQRLGEALSQKQKLKFSGSKLSMLNIGG